MMIKELKHPAYKERLRDRIVQTREAKAQAGRSYLCEDIPDGRE